MESTARKTGTPGTIQQAALNAAFDVEAYRRLAGKDAQEGSAALILEHMREFLSQRFQAMYLGDPHERAAAKALWESIFPE